MKRVVLLFAVAACGAEKGYVPVDNALVPFAAPAVDEAAATPVAVEPPVAPKGPYDDTAKQIINAALASNDAYVKLAWLTDHIGARLAGSAALGEAVDWAVALMKSDGHENVHAEKVKVPHWDRGAESAEIVAPVKRQIAMLGLGLSVGTPKGGITAEVVVVKTKDELVALGDSVKGKIVLFDNPMPAYDDKTGSHYGDTVTFRNHGAALAAAQGAVAVLVRSVTAKSYRDPHTGMTMYDDADPEKKKDPKAKLAPKIPAAAISTEDADLIARLSAEKGERVKLHLTMGAHMLADADSANVIAELRGKEKPDEVVVIGGHLDSWDVGQGAHDDGAGVVIAMQALTTLRKLGLTPKRTIRVVLYTNEEDGVRGALGYGAAHKDELAKHVAAIESDSGAFRPLGFSAEANTSDARLAWLVDVARALAPLAATHIEKSHSGVDVGISMAGSNALLLGLEVDGSTYFDIHHSAADTLDKVDPKLLAQDVAAMAVMAYMLAEDDKLPN